MRTPEIERAVCPPRFLPLVWTAEMCLSHLAEAGDADAQTLFARLGLDAAEIIDSPATILAPEARLTRTAVLALRSRALSEMAAETGAALLVDVPCGLSPRGLKWARAGRPYLGVDLPEVAERMERAALPMLEAEQRAFLRYAAADATDPEALCSAVGAEGGPLCVLTEGFFTYLSRVDAQRLCAGVRRLLEARGGCWITADPEMSLQYLRTLAAIAGERLPETLRRGMERRPVHTGRQLPARPPEPCPVNVEIRADLPAQIAAAEAFLADCGLRAERLCVGERLRGDILPGLLTEEQTDELLSAMETVSFWKLTPG